MLAEVARGRYTPEPPATVCVLSGDVHHSYAAQAHFVEPAASPVYQLTCSPLHNHIPAAVQLAFRLAWSRAAERIIRRLLGLVARLPPLGLEWTRPSGPFFGNDIAEFVADGRQAEAVLSMSAAAEDSAELIEVDRRVLSTEAGNRASAAVTGGPASQRAARCDQ